MAYRQLSRGQGCTSWNIKNPATKSICGICGLMAICDTIHMYGKSLTNGEVMHWLESLVCELQQYFRLPYICQVIAQTEFHCTSPIDGFL